MTKKILRRIFGITLCIVVMIIGVGISEFLPAIGDPKAPANTHVSPIYIEKGVEETHSPNLVTAVLADYRAFDTLLETTVLFAAGLCVVMVIGAAVKSAKGQGEAGWDAGSKAAKAAGRSEGDAGREFDSKAHLNTKKIGADIEVIIPLLVPLIILYGIYVLFHGEISLGGGFQAGALMAIAYILINYMGTRRKAYRMNTQTALILSALGVFIYVIIGLLPIFFGGNFLEYEALPLPVSAGEKHTIGILGIEVGVTIGVMATIIAILEAGLEGGNLDD